jgi:hypothetical protein
MRTVAATTTRPSTNASHRAVRRVRKENARATVPHIRKSSTTPSGTGLLRFHVCSHGKTYCGKKKRFVKNADEKAKASEPTHKVSNKVSPIGAAPAKSDRSPANVDFMTSRRTAESSPATAAQPPESGAATC